MHRERSWKETRKETDPESRKTPPPPFLAPGNFFYGLTAGEVGALVTLVEIRMCRNEHASDCLFGFAVEFDGLPTMTAVAKDGCRLLLVHTYVRGTAGD